MKIKTMICFGTLASMLGLGAADAVVLPNGDFEEGRFDWESPTWPAKSVTSGTIEGVSFGKGRRCLLVTAPAGKNTNVLSSYRPPIPQGTKKMTFSFQIKRDANAPDEGNGMLESRVYVSGKKSMCHTVRIHPKDMKTEWTEYKETFDLPENAAAFSVWFMYNGIKVPVKIYIDDVTITFEK